MASEDDSWALHWSLGPEGVEKIRERSEPWLETLVIDMFMQIKKQRYRDYAEYWDWYDIHTVKQKDGPIVMKFAGTRYEGGELVDNTSARFIIKVMDCRASGME
jgi:hypothetical protein